MRFCACVLGGLLWPAGPGDEPTVIKVDAIPRLIDRLADPVAEIRAHAEEARRNETGQEFGHTWPGFDATRPTLAEGRAMQASYRAWWERHRETFRPTPR